jgi:hypothetical protein
MIKMTIVKVLCRFCKAVGKCGLYLFLDSDMDGNSFSPEEYKKAVPFLNFDDITCDRKGQNILDTDDWQCLADEHMFVLCDSYEECTRLFESVVGDDGPTKTNRYDGPCRVFAMTINEKGEMERTNT